MIFIGGRVVVSLRLRFRYVIMREMNTYYFPIKVIKYRDIDANKKTKQATVEPRLSRS